MSVIAFIPARGGSKSIPLKNIKTFCGKPLIYWNLSALEKTPQIDEIIVATDSEEIANIVSKFNFPKTKIYKRNSKNAQDHSSTESVMLEYINQSNLNDQDLMVLVQATSPLTTEKDFTDAIDLYFQNDFDSILSIVRLKRFFWNENGTSKNYDYRNRPRRQGFVGELMENGAFYINKVGSIQANENRLSGKIGFYEMPEYTAVELDEPDDWIIAENLMKKCKLINSSLNKKIKLFLTDVDGTLTDAGMYYSESGDELKKFNTRDGMGLQLLRENGIKTGILTTENTEIVRKRAEKLQVNYLFQGLGKNEKLDTVLRICEEENISLEEVAYIGDDINCFNLLEKVGLAACPKDAEGKIKAIPDIKIMKKKGGKGCVREFIINHILI